MPGILHVVQIAFRSNADAAEVDKVWPCLYPFHQMTLSPVDNTRAC